MRAGNLTYLAGWPDDAGWQPILKELCGRAGVPTRDLPPGLRCRDTVTERFWFNYDSTEITWDGLTIPAAGVVRQSLSEVQKP